MPSPFPGMDPYLEHPAHWPNVHHGLISEIGNQLTQLLRPRYIGRFARRVYRPKPDDPELDFYLPCRPIADGGTATLAAPRPRIRLLDPEFREAWVEIIEVASRETVTVIEVRSPANKLDGSAGRRSFIEKRDEILNSPIHWVEIDLLRGRPSCEYSVRISKSDEPRRDFAWSIQLEQPLPTIGVPLRSPDPDAPLDLQKVLASAYERAAYDATIDYTGDPTPPLTKAQALWAKKLLPKRRRK